MARGLAVPGGHVMIQGVKAGGGVKDGYVLLQAEDEFGLVDICLPIIKANELGEYLRQEAEFAGSPREEGK